MGIAQFWANRVSLNAETHKYHITRVQPPDEYHYPVDDSFFTNTVAQQSLRFGASLPSLLPTLNLTVPANWTDIANGLYFPFDSDRQYHPEYASYVYGVKVKQADVILTGFPLMTNISKTVRLNDLNVKQNYIKQINYRLLMLTLSMCVRVVSRVVFTGLPRPHGQEWAGHDLGHVYDWLHGLA